MPVRAGHAAWLAVVAMMAASTALAAEPPPPGTVNPNPWGGPNGGTVEPLVVACSAASLQIWGGGACLASAASVTPGALKLTVTFAGPMPAALTSYLAAHAGDPVLSIEGVSQVEGRSYCKKTTYNDIKLASTTSSGGQAVANFTFRGPPIVGQAC